MKNRNLFSQPGAEMGRKRLSIGPDREIFRPEWEEWSILTLTAERTEGGNRK